MTVEILIGDAREKLRALPDKSVNCVVTSPPYWGLRDYKIKPLIWGGYPECKHDFSIVVKAKPQTGGTEASTLGPESGGYGISKEGMVRSIKRQSHGGLTTAFCRHCGAWRGAFGLEPTYQLYIEHIVEIFREVWRVLRDDGTLWLNMGDCYATYRSPGGKTKTNNGERAVDWGHRSKGAVGSNRAQRGDDNGGESYGPRRQPNRTPQPNLKYKDLCMMPARVAIALQDAGWYLRRDIIWHKKNPMPESVYDRPTTAHEFIFLFAKSANTLCWRHDETGEWTWTKPEPQWRWRHRNTRVVTAVPQKTGPGRRWFKFNLWSGFDYYYDFAAIMEPSSPDSDARAARGRAKEHKHTNGSDLSGKPHGIASARRWPGATRRRQGGMTAMGTMARCTGMAVGRRRKKLPLASGALYRRISSRAARTPVSTSNAYPVRKTTAASPTSTCTSARPISSLCATSARYGRSPPSRSRKRISPPSPPALIEPCILAGCPKGGTVLDPFGGAGTTGLVADLNGRNAILIEINPKYAAMAEARIARQRMGPEEKKRAAIKQSGKLKSAKGLPLFKTRKPVTRDEKSKSVPAPGEAAA